MAAKQIAFESDARSRIIPDINRSGADELSGNADPGSEITNQETSEQAGSTPRTGISIDVPINPVRP